MGRVLLAAHVRQASLAARGGRLCAVAWGRAIWRRSPPSIPVLLSKVIDAGRPFRQQLRDSPPGEREPCREVSWTFWRGAVAAFVECWRRSRRVRRSDRPGRRTRRPLHSADRRPSCVRSRRNADAPRSRLRRRRVSRQVYYFCSDSEKQTFLKTRAVHEALRRDARQSPRPIGSNPYHSKMSSNP